MPRPKNILLNIPKHTTCENCGECCGPVPLSKDEIKKIQNYLDVNEYPRSVIERFHPPLECIFRDNEARKCSIYPVRPLICRLFGVAQGMNCPKGNSAHILPELVYGDNDFAAIQNEYFTNGRKYNDSFANERK